MTNKRAHVQLWRRPALARDAASVVMSGLVAALIMAKWLPV